MTEKLKAILSLIDVTARLKKARWLMRVADQRLEALELAEYAETKLAFLNDSEFDHNDTRNLFRVKALLKDAVELMRTGDFSYGTASGVADRKQPDESLAFAITYLEGLTRIL